MQLWIVPPQNVLCMPSLRPNETIVTRCCMGFLLKKYPRFNVFKTLQPGWSLESNAKITPVLRSLHWLPIRESISYKLLLFVYKIVNGLAPSYLETLIADYTPVRNLRSNSKGLLIWSPGLCNLWRPCFLDIAVPQTLGCSSCQH